ncbi:oxalate decarboxylase oxdC, putative [Metarhizium acridum CQMa 102]|uniref:Oxalate decarboxylase oxdC, putative n=1 Tax=Metarhizium acridum (strain CQMa 102) TaxID=655827 RepID=E9DVC2_METAQ|nr:oxalate decarboxylase oxdC, putative [Metarhizium acridum CQMa 102]EFY92299.1 oxalate decarboxylase oxdC, putative [Metarhizium acridum CQMa 102]
MKFTSVTALVASCLAASALAAPRLENRDEDKFDQGLAISKTGKGGPISGGTNQALDLQNPDNLGRQSTDNGIVPNLKWSFSDSKPRILKGGWVREQVIQDLPQSHDISGAQQHLKKGAIRELHWHRVAEWGFVYKGRILVSAVDENGKYQAEELNYGDIWYFPKGVAHTVQGLEDENEFLLVFDEGDFDKVGTTFNIDDWLAHTPKDILAKNFGVPESVFDNIPTPNPYILNATVSEKNVTGAVTPVASGNSSFVYRTLEHPAEKIGGQGGVFRKIDSTNFPISKTIAATFVTLKPGGLRELHWHPNAEEWLYFHQGTARATAFIGNANARTFDFRAGDTAVFPDNSGHYVENTSKTEDLIWIEIYKSDRVADIPLTQWLALTPPDVVSQALKVPIEFVEKLKKEKQVFVK